MTTQRRVCAIRDPIPAYRQGIARELASAGYETAEAGDCSAWVKRVRHAVDTANCQLAIILSIRSAADLDVIRGFRDEHEDVVVLALLVDPTAEGYGDAFAAGAWGAVDYAATPAAIVEALEAALAGVVQLPRPVVIDLAVRSEKRWATSAIDQCDVQRLTALANGWSVAQLARHENFSTRDMFRRLQKLYRHLGVSNRHQAVVIAARSGLLDHTLNAAALESEATSVQ